MISKKYTSGINCLANFSRCLTICGALLCSLLFLITAGSISVLAAPQAQDPILPVIDATVPLDEGTIWAPNDLSSAASIVDIAWGDVDNDGDLDLAVANRTTDFAVNFFDGAVNQVFLNEDGQLSERASWASSEKLESSSLAWGDVDGDGDLDLAVGNNGKANLYVSSYDRPNSLYLNEGGTLTPLASWFSEDQDATNNIAWADVDGDGDLDLSTANSTLSSDGGSVKIYLNNNGVLETVAGWRSEGTDGASDLAWADMDGDGDLDLAVGGEYRDTNSALGKSPSKVYRNEGGVLNPIAVWTPEEDKTNLSPRVVDGVAWGDVDNDGDLDLAIDERVYLNHNGKLSSSASWQSHVFYPYSGRPVWGDVDNDGDLDLAIGSRIHLNHIGTEWHYDPKNNYGQSEQTPIYPGVGLDPRPAWEVSDRTSSIPSFVDIDGDSDLEFFLSFADIEPSIYQNFSSFINETPAHSQSLSRIETAPGILLGRNAEWADWDQDSDLDLVTSTGVFLNESHKLTQLADWNISDSDYLEHIALGDIDNDNQLDIAVIGRFIADKPYILRARVYRNEAGRLRTDDYEQIEFNEPIDLAWGDVDNDGNLDLAVVGGPVFSREPLSETSAIFKYVDGSFQLSWSPFQQVQTYSLAWGDMDNDGDLDLAIGTDDACMVYLNDGGMLTRQEIWRSTDRLSAMSLAWGDVDNDGNLDLAAGGRYDRIYRNEDGLLGTEPFWQSKQGSEVTYHQDTAKGFTWIDINGDGHLDLASGPNVYWNQNGLLTQASNWLNSNSTGSPLVAWGDVDGDGDADAASVSWEYSPSLDIHINHVQTKRAGERPTSISIDMHDSPNVITSSTGNYSSAVINHDDLLTIPYTILHQADQPLREVKAYYSLNGGGKWEPAVGLHSLQEITEPSYIMPVGEHHLFLPVTFSDGPLQSGTVTTKRAFEWDVIGSGFVGQSDNVVVRLEAHFSCVNSCQRAYVASQTFPMRVRGRQLQVLHAEMNEPAVNAVVYRLPDQQARGALPFSDARGQTLRTDTQGYLQGRDEINYWDRLVALAPISPEDIDNTAARLDDRVTLYHTSAEPIAPGLMLDLASEVGVQQLMVSADNPLMVFDLDVSLEWDVRNDADYHDKLASDLRRTSELIYDWTNGQAALGQITVYQNKENWQEADVRIHATNSLRPFATIGGRTPNIHIEEITAAQNGTNDSSYQVYGPGRINMGVVWNRYGKAGENLGEDWARTLAHELGHYLFYLHDNYLGIEDGRITRVDDCPGVMSNPYSELTSEFHPVEAWQNNCSQTLSQQLVGRSDWETIQHFYPWLTMPTGAIDTPATSGPNVLPLMLTEVEFAEIESESATIDVPTFYISDDYNNAYIASSSSQAVLFQGDSMIDLGTPQRDRISAYSARDGDLLCIYDLDATPVPLTGCEAVTPGDDEIVLLPQPDWQPEIIITPVTDRSVSIEVLNMPDDLELKARIYPENASLSVPAPPAIDLTFDGSHYSGTFVLEQTTLAAHIHLYEYIDERGVLTRYALGGAPRFELNEGDTLVMGDGQTLVMGDGQAREIGSGDTLVMGDGQTLVMGDGQTLVMGDGGTLVMGDGQTLVMGDGQTLVMGDGGTLVMGDGQTLVMGDGQTLVMGDGQAPARSSDGQVALYGRQLQAQPKHFFALQPATILPSPLLWAEVVGSAYRVTATPNAPDIAGAYISFNYLGRNVDEDDEDLLRIYYWDGAAWNELETSVDPEHNIAVAEAQGIGVYALMYSVDIALQPLPNSQWDLFGYPLNDSRPITDALVSLSGHYTTVYHYDSTDSVTPWQMYDINAPEWVNDLDTLEFGELYWINLSQAMTLRLHPTGSQVQSASVNPYPAPPATYYGLIEGSDTIELSTDMTITASIDGVQCGQGDILSVESEIVYRIHVASESEIEGCWAVGKAVTFQLAEQQVTMAVEWDSIVVNQQDLQVVAAASMRRVQATGLKVQEQGDQQSISDKADRSSTALYLPVAVR